MPLRLATPDQVIVGAGTLENDLSVHDFAAMKPGDLVGTLTVTGDLTLGEAGVYDWQLIDPNVLSADGSGWDLLESEARLLVKATESQPFVIRLEGLDEAGESGVVAGFDPAREYRWPIARAAAIEGFDADHFRLDASSASLPGSCLVTRCLGGSA